VTKTVKRKAPEPHVDHDVHVVKTEKKPAIRKAPATATTEPVVAAAPVKAKPAAKKKTAAKAGDA
jgi:hypothetical protein